MTDLSAILAAVQSSALAEALRTSFVVYPLVNAAHVLGAGGMVTLVWLMHAAEYRVVLRPARRIGSVGFYRRLSIAVMTLMLATGSLLFSVKAGDYAANPAFRVKMLLILLAIANVALHHWLRDRSQLAGEATALVSALLWPCILLAGRFIGFV